MFYVTVRSHTRTGVLVGPFTAQQDAQNYVDPASKAAGEIDDWAHFYSYGTARIPGYSKPGKLNDRVGYTAPVG